MTIVQRQQSLHAEASATLDPDNWDDIRAQGHRMLDDMFDYAASIRERPVWSPIPDDVRARFHAGLPRQASDLGDVYREFTDFIVPYATGNVHPGFMGWVHGGGTAVGMLAEMLAAGLNANLGGRDHIPIEVERQVVEWTRQMFGFPGGASGIFVTGIPTVQPTIVMNYEASWDRSVPALGGQIRANAFHQTNDSIAALSGGFSIVNGVPLVTPANIGNSEATGLELSVKGSFLQNWRWGASYTPEVITDHFAAGLPVSATNVDYQHTTPTHVLKANLGWASGPWEIDGYLQYKSSFYGIAQPPSAVAVALGGGQLVRISDYVALDGRVAYKLNDWATLALTAQDFSQASQQQTSGANVERQVFGTLTVSF